MKKKIELALLIFTIIIFGIKSEAQEVRKLTVEECINIGIANSKTLKISNTKVDYAKSKADEAYNGLLPSLKFNAGYTRLSEVEPFEIKTPTGAYTISRIILNTYMTKTSLQQPLFTGARLKNTSDMLDYQAAASEEDFNKDKSQLEFDIKNTYWSYFKALEFKKSIEENIKQTKAHLTDIQMFFTQGMATENDVLKVKVQLANTQLMLVDAENNIELSQISLNNLLGIPLNTQIELASTVEYKSNNFPEVNNLIEQALNDKPDIKSMELRVKAGESGVKMAKAGWYPQIFMGANYYYSRPNSRIFPSQDKFNGTWDLGITLSYDIWNWMTTARQTEQAEATLDQTKYSLEQMKDLVSLEVSQSYLNFSKAKERITVSVEVVKQAEENHRVTNEKFKTGLAINSDLLDAEIALLQAKINYSSALADYEIALAKLEKAIGK